MRFKWGNMEFSQPSRFLSEIDPQFVDSDCDLSRRNPTSPREDDGRGFDDFDGYDRSGAARRTTYGQRPYGGARQGYGTQHAEQRRDGRTAIEELRHRYDVRYQQQRAATQTSPAAAQRSVGPDPRLVSQPQRTENLRRIPVTPRNDVAPASPCGYAVGERVEHPKFGAPSSASRASPPTTRSLSTSAPTARRPFWPASPSCASSDTHPPYSDIRPPHPPPIEDDVWRSYILLRDRDVYTIFPK